MQHLNTKTCQMKTTSDTQPNTRPRLELLDGLRGVGALLVILFHFGEAFATSPLNQFMNHAYLAVDFFFVLSGFVIGYAYDSRWNAPRPMSPKGFMLRRVIRLQPMVVLGVILGVISYLITGACRWDGSPMGFDALIVAALCGMLLIPAWPGCFYDMRGNGEMFSLNGPEWSLFFEYIGSLLYAFLLHKLSNRKLLLTIAGAAVAMIGYNLMNYGGFYTQGAGWSFAEHGFFGGGFRMVYCFGTGVLMSRWKRNKNIPGAFWICAGGLALICALPNLGSTEPSPWNMVYDTVATMFILPVLVFTGACGNTSDKISTATCNFLGRISYPVYIIHYPAMYMFYHWVWTNGITVAEALPVCGCILVSVIALAWLSAKYYDEPLRRQLTKRLL